MKLLTEAVWRTTLLAAIDVARSVSGADAESIVQAVMAHHGEGLPQTDWVQTRWLAALAEDDAKRLAQHPEDAGRCAALHQLLAGRLPSAPAEPAEEEGA